MCTVLPFCNLYSSVDPCRNASMRVCECERWRFPGCSVKAWNALPRRKIPSHAVVNHQAGMSNLFYHFPNVHLSFAFLCCAPLFYYISQKASWLSWHTRMCLKLVDFYLLESNVRVEFHQDFLVEKSGVLPLYCRPLQTEILCKDTVYWKKWDQHPVSCYIVISLWLCSLSRTILMWRYVKLDLVYFCSAWVNTRALCLRWTCWWHLIHLPSQGQKNAAWSSIQSRLKPERLAQSICVY